MTDTIAHNPAAPTPLASHGADRLAGRFVTPADRSIAGLALALGALTVGRTTIEGGRLTNDIVILMTALRQLGVGIETQDRLWHVHGLGVGGLLAPEAPVNLGTSPLVARLLLGLLAPHALEVRLEGDASLRPVLAPLLDALATLGLEVFDATDGALPLSLRGPSLPVPLHMELGAPSEAVKTVCLLAAAQIAGTLTVVEPASGCDHIEKLLALFGAGISVVHDEASRATISINGLTELKPHHVVVPGDPSAAAFPLVAALVVPGSDLLVENVLVNPARTGLIDTLLEMGGDIQFLNQREIGGEHVADLRVRSSRLKGIRVSADHAAAMLDDIPILAMAAACAHGETVIEGLAALREGSCDRLAATAAGLATCKVTVAEGDSTLTIGGDGKVPGGGTVRSLGDHQIAASFLVLGLASKQAITLDDTSGIAAHLPDFMPAMAAIGATFQPVKDTTP